ncbi:S-adenosyl-L-methionine-dependent methyltransferase [Morchella snyderi]|nr:S-adenosyl-L-methionine-dependent methyltransferase [Morchella snyderi]
MAASSSSSSSSSPSSAQEVVALRVPRSLVKTVKTALEAQGLFGRRITRVDDDDDGDDGDDDDTGDNAGSAVKPAEEEQEGAKAEEMFTITTTIPAGAGSATLLTTLSLPSAAAALTTTTTTTAAPAAAAPPRKTNPLTTALTTLLHTLPLPPATRAALLATAPTHYSLYPPLLLLPTGTFTRPPWPTLLPTLPTTFFTRLASALNCTHLAINAPIPPTSTTRTPLALTPLHGAFTTPTTLWVRTTQNGIIQTWPPAHCMFSRGNMREKARLLRLPAIRGAQVADLYAGIGYFTFSYAAAGAARVWCWEVSRWSAEALCRGARENGWRAEAVRCGEQVPGGLAGLDARAVRIVVFVESNACAVGRLRALGVSGVRHVNMGYLPDCRAVWPAAVEMLGGGGGVAHVHGNVKVGAEREYSEGVVEAFAALLGEGEGEGGGRVSCEHVEVVKTYAPGVVHCVFDIKIEGRQEQQ